MFLKNKQTGALVQVLDAEELIDPTKTVIHGRVQAGQEEQDPEEFSKDGLLFPSDENLPQCWLDPDYRLH